MHETRSGEFASMQIAMMGILDATEANFSLPNGMPFNVKNEDTSPVVLEIRLAGMPDGEYIATSLDSGWNPEIVAEVKATDTPHNLKWGY